jgi:hypothetical protein
LEGNGTHRSSWSLMLGDVLSHRLRLWWQTTDRTAHDRFDKDVGGGGGGGGGYVRDEMDGGGRRPNNFVKADQQPGPLRPNALTVPETDFTVKDTNPDLGKAVDYNPHFDLVEQMTYLYVRVVRARNLLGKDQNGFSDPVSLIEYLDFTSLEHDFILFSKFFHL